MLLSNLIIYKAQLYMIKPQITQIIYSKIVLFKILFLDKQQLNLYMQLLANNNLHFLIKIKRLNFKDQKEFNF
jgi:hypothetical protein